LCLANPRYAIRCRSQVPTNGYPAYKTLISAELSYILWLHRIQEPALDFGHQNRFTKLTTINFLY
jgi:hypothetical protein